MRHGVTLEWRGFELHPQLPAGGVAAATLYPPGVRERFHGALRKHADRLGLKLQDPPDHVPNTRAALAATAFARAQGEGALRAFRERVMAAWWADGEDIEDADVLRRLAAEAGLDGDAAAEASRDPAWIQQVWDAREEAADRWVTSIPTVFVGSIPVIGLQPVEAYERALAKAAGTGNVPPVR